MSFTFSDDAGRCISSSRIGSHRFRIGSTLLLLGVCLSVGCQVFPQKDSAAETTMVAESRGKYLVEVKPLGRSGRTETFELTGDHTVSHALKEVGIGKRRGTYEIELMRTNPQTGQRHKMMVTYDPAKRSVPVEQDYSIYPNDHLIVREVTVNPIDDLFGGSVFSGLTSGL